MKYGAVPHVQYFGVWSAEGADHAGVAAAYRDMHRAVARCFDEEVRGPELQDALDYLRGHMRRRRSLDMLCNALDLSDPRQRHRQASQAIKGIAAALYANGFSVSAE